MSPKLIPISTGDLEYVNHILTNALNVPRDFDLCLKLILTDISISDIIILAKRYKIPLLQTERCQKETSNPCVNILILYVFTHN